MRAFLSRFMCVIVLAAVVHGQGAKTNMPTMDQANQLYSAKNWNAAAPAFEAITRAEPSNALAWLRLGVSRHKLGQYTPAVEAYKHIESDPQVGPSALYREAASLAKLNGTRRRLHLWIKPSMPVWPSQARSSKMLTSLHCERNLVLKRSLRRLTPLHARAFIVLNIANLISGLANGTLSPPKAIIRPEAAAFNPSLINACCWKTGLAVEAAPGKSFNHYDTSRKIWMQDWVDSQSNSIHFEGKLEDGVMSYYADSQKPDGTPIRRHLQFFKLDVDHVRQFSQQSSDGGKSWTPEYDFTYNRKK